MYYFCLPNLLTLSDIKTVNLVYLRTTYEILMILAVKNRNKPAHVIMVLITYASSERLGEPVHPRSLTRAFTVRTHEV